MCFSLPLVGRGGEGRKKKKGIEPVKFASGVGSSILMLWRGVGQTLTSLSRKLPRWKTKDHAQEMSPLFNKRSYLWCGGLAPLLLLLAALDGEEEEGGAPIAVVVRRWLRRSMEYSVTSAADPKRCRVLAAAIFRPKDGPAAL
jgi:hypothetical protein